MSDRIEMNVKLQVTVPQGLALQAMFNHWNNLAAMGCSRMIGFYVDGDGNFKPNCQCSFSGEVPELTEELVKACIVADDGNGAVDFDFDGVAWALHPEPEPASPTPKERLALEASFRSRVVRKDRK